MKKIIIKIFLIVILSFSIDVYAGSYNLSLEADSYNIEKNSTVDAYIVLKNINDINYGINACQTIINTSSNVVINSISGINGWITTAGSTLILDSSSGATNYTRVAKVNLSVNGEGFLSLSSTNCTNGEEEFTTSGSSISFKIKTTTTSTTTKTTTTQKTTTKSNISSTSTTTTISTESSLYLKKLELENYDINFQKEQFIYRLTVPNNIEKIDFIYELEDKRSSIKVLGADKLIVGENKIELIITNDQGNKNTYTLNVYREKTIDFVENNEEIIINTLNTDIKELKVKVDINDNNKIITTKILELLKNLKKNIVYEIYDNDKKIYSYRIYGNSIVKTNEIDFGVKFYSDYNDIETVINGRNNKIINFNYTGDLPFNTEITFYNINLKEDGYLYHYIPNLNELKFQNKVSLINNNLVLKLDKCVSEYVYLEEKISGVSILYIIIILIGILELILFIVFLIIIIRRKNRKVINVEKIETLSNIN